MAHTLRPWTIPQAQLCSKTRRHFFPVDALLDENGHAAKHQKYYMFMLAALHAKDGDEDKFSKVSDCTSFEC